MAHGNWWEDWFNGGKSAGAEQVAAEMVKIINGEGTLPPEVVSKFDLMDGKVHTYQGIAYGIKKDGTLHPFGSVGGETISPDDKRIKAAEAAYKEQLQNERSWHEQQGHGAVTHAEYAAQQRAEKADVRAEKADTRAESREERIATSAEESAAAARANVALQEKKIYLEAQYAAGKLTLEEAELEYRKVFDAAKLAEDRARLAFDRERLEEESKQKTAERESREREGAADRSSREGTTQFSGDVSLRGQDIDLYGNTVTNARGLASSAAELMSRSMPFMAPTGTSEAIAAGNERIRQAGAGVRPGDMTPVPKVAPQPMPFNPATFMQEMFNLAMAQLSPTAAAAAGQKPTMRFNAPPTAPPTQPTAYPPAPPMTGMVGPMPAAGGPTWYPGQFVAPISPV